MFKITYDHRVKGDVGLLSKTMRKRVELATRTKLIEHPEIHGKPLRHSLSGFRSLRVGDYRILFILRKRKEVFILLITHRKNVYKDVLKRL